MEGDDPRWSRGDVPPPNEKLITERAKFWAKLMREDTERRKPAKEQLTLIGSVMAYFSIFCAAALMLCFVLWVASCTLKAMKGA